MQYVDLGDVKIAEARPLKPPSGSTALIDADCGTILSIAPREGFEDMVMGFEIYSAATKDGKTEWGLNTDWIIRHSFAMFVRNILEYFGAGRGDLVAPTFRPGSTVQLRTDAPVEQVQVESPRGNKQEIPRGTLPGFAYTGTEELGLYQVREGAKPEPTQQFAVNLFDVNESNIAGRPFVVVGAAESAAPDVSTQARQEVWPWLLFAAFVVLMVEWYIYNRRVYL